MERKIIITVGCSSSGKSTWAALLVQENPEKYIRINRDDVRSLLYGYTDSTINGYYLRPDTKSLEKQVSRYIDTLIYDSLELGKIVICDNTHLKREHIMEYRKWNVPVELEFFKVSLDFCISNNLNRERQVDESIIKKQYNQFKSLVSSIKTKPLKLKTVVLENDSSKPWCYVFDIDGTLAHKGGRNAFDWKSVGNDKLDEEIGEICMNTNKNYEVVIATGRDEVCRKETTKWLHNNVSFYGEVLMRPEKDMRSDWKVKQEMAKKICEKYYIAGWYDDRLQVTRHLRALDIKVLNVKHGNF